jgi:hypothetical protein
LPRRPAGGHGSRYSRPRSASWSTAPAHNNLIGGLLLDAGAIAAAALVYSFVVFIAMFAVFGFVTTGFHVGAMVSPVIFGQLLDRAHPHAMFLWIAGCALVAIATVAFGMSGRRTA